MTMLRKASWVAIAIGAGACAQQAPPPKSAETPTISVPPDTTELHATETAPPPGSSPSLDELAQILTDSPVWLIAYLTHDDQVWLTLGARASSSSFPGVIERIAASDAFGDVVIDAIDRSPQNVYEARLHARRRAGEHADLELYSFEQAKAWLTTDADPFAPKADEPADTRRNATVASLRLLAVTKEVSLPGTGLLDDGTGRAFIVRSGDRIGRSPCSYRVTEVRASAVVFERDDEASCPDPQRLEMSVSQRR